MERETNWFSVVPNEEEGAEKKILFCDTSKKNAQEEVAEKQTNKHGTTTQGFTCRSRRSLQDHLCRSRWTFRRD